LKLVKRAKVKPRGRGAGATRERSATNQKKGKFHGKSFWTKILERCARQGGAVPGRGTWEIEKNPGNIAETNPNGERAKKDESLRGKIRGVEMS